MVLNRKLLVFGLFSGFLMASASAESRTESHPRITIMTQAIQEAPQDADLYLERAYLHLEAGHLEQAERDFDRVDQYGLKARTEFGRAQLALKKQQPEQALAHINQYLERHPKHEKALHFRARLLTQQKQIEPAIADYQTLIELPHARNPDYFYELASLQTQLTPPQYRLAVATLDKAQTDRGSLLHLHQQAIEYCKAAGDFEEALTRLENIKPWLGDTVEWQLDKADLLTQLGRKKEASKLYRVVIQQLQKNDRGDREQRFARYAKQQLVQLTSN